ncbi:MAG: hypothetical protein ACRDJG_09090 [Actinomycetota bacterium]
MARRPLWHLGRLRSSEDREFLQPGLCDELLINANQLENSPNGTAAYLEETQLPYVVDPMLWRLQLPAWWRNEKGDVKRNYSRLASRYSEGTDVRMAEGPLLDCVAGDAQWRRIAQNIVSYQRGRLSEQIDLFHPEGLAPQRILAPALVTLGSREDRLNRLLAEASAEAAGEPVAVTFVLPRERLAVPEEVIRALNAVAKDGVWAYFIWTPGVTEELLLSDHQVFSGLLRVIQALAESGVPVVHVQGTYLTEALHDIGVAGIVHHPGWVDKGEPAAEPRGALRSCQTYVPGLRHCAGFPEAKKLGRSLDESQYLERYCDCRFCARVFQLGQHPLDLLLEDQPVKGRRRTPTSRAVTANAWHYLNARRLEVEAFRKDPALEVLEQDIARAVALAGQARGLERLVAELRSA